MRTYERRNLWYPLAALGLLAFGLSVESSGWILAAHVAVLLGAALQLRVRAWADGDGVHWRPEGLRHRAVAWHDIAVLEVDLDGETGHLHGLRLHDAEAETTDVPHAARWSDDDRSAFRRLVQQHLGQGQLVDHAPSGQGRTDRAP